MHYTIIKYILFLQKIYFKINSIISMYNLYLNSVHLFKKLKHQFLTLKLFL
jgi:hypothetical protein